MNDLTKSKREEFYEEYPYELVKDNPFLIHEAIGWLRGTQRCIPSISEWSNIQEKYLQTRAVELASRKE